jgi:antirestriction protein ArdC
MPCFLVPRTINPRSGSVSNKGEKSTPVIYYKILEKRNEAGNMVVREDGRPARIPFVRWANVFNLDQTEGIPAPEITASQNVTQPHEKAAAIVENAKLCPIHHGGFAALFAPGMPDFARGNAAYLGAGAWD